MAWGSIPMKLTVEILEGFMVVSTHMNLLLGPRACSQMHGEAPLVMQICITTPVTLAQLPLPLLVPLVAHCAPSYITRSTPPPSLEGNRDL